MFQRQTSASHGVEASTTGMPFSDRRRSRKTISDAAGPESGPAYRETGGFNASSELMVAVEGGVVDLDELTKLVVEHCKDFDADARALLPLPRVYRPDG